MRLLTPSAIRNRRSQSGSILGVSAIAMLAILGAVGLAVDIGHMYLVAAELQNAADAAALAGASALNGGQGGITRAVDRAITAMNQYEFNRTAIGLTRGNVTFAENLTAFDNGGTGMTEAVASATETVARNIRFVQVRIPAKTITTLVGQAFLQASLSEGGGAPPEFAVARSAVAGQSVALNRFCNIAPFSVAFDDTNNVPMHASSGCVPPDPTKFTRGCTYTIRLPSGGGGGGGRGGGGGGGGIEPGNYLLLAIGSDRGGADLRSRLGIGVDSCFLTGQTISTEPGLTAGPVRQGLNTRFDNYSGSGMSPAEFPPDLNIKPGINYAQYKSGSTNSLDFQAPSHAGRANRRILMIPIINASSYDSGRNEVTIFSVGAFFMQSPVASTGGGGEIVAEYIGSEVAVGGGGYVIGGGPGIPGLTVPVLYR